jgi:polyisoprenoid-binding protein YceI
LHPIRTETRGLEGWVEAVLLPGGELDHSFPVRGELEISVDRLTSGNHLYDREMKRRMEARKFPTITGRITTFHPTGQPGRYQVGGDLSFHGHTRSFEHEMTVDVRDESRIELRGDYVFDIREFNMKPPSMLMLKVYPQIAVRIELFGDVKA